MCGSPQRSVNNKKRLRFFGTGLSSTTKQQNMIPASPPPAISGECASALADLKTVLADRVSRNRLITTLGKLDTTPNPGVLVRFCIAIDEYEKTRDKVEKKSKGRKIIAMFVQNGAMFQLPEGTIEKELVLIV